jgi:hypothetical protein
MLASIIQGGLGKNVFVGILSEKIMQLSKAFCRFCRHIVESSITLRVGGLA